MRVRLLVSALAVSISTPAFAFDFASPFGVVDIEDLDVMCAAVAAGVDWFDVTGDDKVDELDLIAMRAVMGNEVGGTSLLQQADWNADGSVDVSDWGIWNANRFTYGTWSDGDANCDGSIDVSDWGLWNANKFTTIL